MSWGYHWRRPVTYLRCCDHLLFRVCFHSIVHICWWEEAQPKNLSFYLFISSRLPQSVFFCIRTFLSFSPKPCRRQYYWFFGLFRRCIWIISSKPRRRYIFDDDLGHGNHSEVLLLFVGCIVNFIVSYLICMFQDSVPAGSYNDPFLSVCVCQALYQRVLHLLWLTSTNLFLAAFFHKLLIPLRL